MLTNREAQEQQDVQELKQPKSLIALSVEGLKRKAFDRAVSIGKSAVEQIEDYKNAKITQFQQGMERHEAAIEKALASTNMAFSSAKEQVSQSFQGAMQTVSEESKFGVDTIRNWAGYRAALDTARVELAQRKSNLSPNAKGLSTTQRSEVVELATVELDEIRSRQKDALLKLAQKNLDGTMPRAEFRQKWQTTWAEGTHQAGKLHSDVEAVEANLRQANRTTHPAKSARIDIKNEWETKRSTATYYEGDVSQVVRTLAVTKSETPVTKYPTRPIGELPAAKEQVAIPKLLEEPVLISPEATKAYVAKAISSPIKKDDGVLTQEAITAEIKSTSRKRLLEMAKSLTPTEQKVSGYSRMNTDDLRAALLEPQRIAALVKE